MSYIDNVVDAVLLAADAPATRAGRAYGISRSIANDITSDASAGSIGMAASLLSTHSPDSTQSDHVANAVLIVLRSV